jgi:pimeloyl-ACP methyl ester carboxylesterase
MVSIATSLAPIQAEKWRSGTVEITGGQLAYHRTGGAGPVLVLAHGLTDNGLCWGRTAQALCGDYDIVMLDARGHGNSSRMVPGMLHDPGRDLAEAIAGLALKTPIVMGHSVGASATAAYANANPARAAKVILEDPPFLPEIGIAEAQHRREGFRRQIAEMQTLTDAEITAFGQRTSPLWHEDEFPAWTQGKRQVDVEAVPLRFLPWQATIDQIAAPTLLIYGETERGGLVTPEIACEAMQINPLIQAVQITGAGHNIRRENCSGFLTAVRAFLGAKPGVQTPAG